MSEFEDREKELDQPTPEGLGDLPQDKSLMRGEMGSDHEEPQIIPPGPLSSGRKGSGIPMDIEREARISRRPGEIGTVTMPYGVTSVYDARPINGRDFLFTGTDSFQAALEQPSPVIEVSYTVPGGYTGVWRKFSVTPAFIPSFGRGEKLNGQIFEQIKYTLLVNQTVVPDYEDMSLGEVVNMFNLDTFVLGLEGQTFTVRATYGIQVAIGACGLNNNFHVNVGIYGNNLLTRGLPLAFQIASQTETGSVAT